VVAGALVVRAEVAAEDGVWAALLVVAACVGAAEFAPAVVAVCGVPLLVVFPGSACAYPPASTTAPAADATVIQPVAVRTRRSPRSRASARSCAVSVVRCGKVGLLSRRSLPGRDLHGPESSLTDRRFGIC
jgi:hypothetical protein